MIRWMVAALALASAPATLAGQVPDSAKGRLTRDGVLRASAQVDSVFVDRKKPAGEIDTGDWASYLLARLGGGRIQDGLGIEVKADSSQIEVRGKLQDLPPETRALLGPLATMVDSSTVIAATITMQRTGREVVRFWLKATGSMAFRFPSLSSSP